MSTQAQAFNTANRAALGQWRSQSDRVLLLVRGAFADYEQTILANMASSTDWDIHRAIVVREMLTDATRTLELRLSQGFRQEALRASALSLSTVDDALTAAGVNLSHIPAVIPERQLALINDILPDLIVDVTTTAKQGVQQAINQVMLGGTDKQEALAKIGRHVGSLKGSQLKPGQVIPRAQVRARTILRTEINRISSLTTTQRINELAEHDPNVGLKWVHFPSREPRGNHVALHGTVIYPAKDELFNVGGTLVKGPHATELPAGEVINCHCKAVVKYDFKGSPPATADPIIDRVA